jgi:acetyltransferase-like isoleucine patch superfamily enzyme
MLKSGNSIKKFSKLHIQIIFRLMYHFFLYLYFKIQNIITNFLFVFYRVERVSWIHGYGFLHVYTTKSASVKIGNHFRYNSNTFYNRYGVRNSCHLSALQDGAEIVIGNNVGISGVYISAWKKIVICDNVIIGANTIITDCDWHQLQVADHCDKNKIKSKPVLIEENVWIGANVQIYKGVTIGKGSVIGGGSVVYENVPDNTLVKGNPARNIRSLTD